MPVTVNHYKNLHDAAKGQFNWMKKAEGGFNKLYDIYDNKIYPKEKRFPVSFEENAPVKIALKYRCVYCTTEISHNQRGGIPNEKLPKKCPFCGEAMLLEDYRVDVEKHPQGIKPILGEVLFPPYIQDYSYDLQGEQKKPQRNKKDGKNKWRPYLPRSDSTELPPVHKRMSESEEI